MADYRDLVEYIVKNIVDNPESVVVEAHGRQRAETVEIRLDPGDVGRVIGKGGRNIEAIRSLVKAAAIKDHRRVNVEVIADDDEDVEDSQELAASEGAPTAEAHSAASEPVEVGEG
jgi:predicted RNA-binding protein YlqC (UPF0109 family)